MTILVTGSAGHLGEALMRSFRAEGVSALGIDVHPSPFTDRTGSIGDRDFIAHCMDGVRAVIHAATLHKPHVAIHSASAFVDTNIAGTLVLLEAAVAAQVGAFVFTSTTSAFGAALTPRPGEPAGWIDEDVAPVPRNIYGVTKVAAEGLCELFARREDLPVVILRTSRFFAEEDDDAAVRRDYSNANVQANELLNRRVDLADVVEAHRLALGRAGAIGFGRYIVSATTPFSRSDLADLRRSAPDVVERLFPGTAALYAARHWRMFPSLDRVYVNDQARAALGWQPKYDFAFMLDCLRRDADFRSPLARAVGSKGYHAETFTEGPYPVR